MGGKAAKTESAALPSDEAQGDVANETEKAASSEPAAQASRASAEKAASSKDAETAEKAGGMPFTVKNGRVAVVSKARAGKKIIAKTGEPIEFGADGKANVRVEDALYLSACAGFEFE